MTFTVLDKLGKTLQNPTAFGAHSTSFPYHNETMIRGEKNEKKPIMKVQLDLSMPTGEWTDKSMLKEKYLWQYGKHDYQLIKGYFFWFVIKFQEK